MDSAANRNSPIIWPSKLVAERDMVYESLDLLYKDFNMDTFGQTFSFIVSCSRLSLFKNNEARGLYHKVDVKALPDLAAAKISVTHEVLPGLESSAQIIPVNHRLKVACFDSGCIMPVSNFGQGRTFNTNVRGRLSHHTGQVTCLAANSSGTKVASGCSAGELTVYQAREAEIEFVSRTTQSNASFITAMSFDEPMPGFTSKVNDRESSSCAAGDFLLVYTTNAGRVCLADTRCPLAGDIECQLVFSTEPRISLTSLARIRSKPGHLVYLGGSRGELLACDLRNPGRYIWERPHGPADGTIRRLKEVKVQTGTTDKSFLAFSDSSNSLKIIDLDTNQPNHPGWLCDRQPEGRIRDLIQVDNKIITCGERCSIGCWEWDEESLSEPLN